MQKQYLVYAGHIETSQREQGSQHSPYRNHFRVHNQSRQGSSHPHHQQNDKQNRNLPYKYGGTRYQESTQSKYRPHIIHNTVYVGLQHFPSLPLTPQRSRKGYDWKQEP